MKTVLFVPGFQEDIQSRDYSRTIDAIKSAGYNVEFVSINWLRTTIDSWTVQLDSIYDRYDTKDTILAGFSFGAMTALLSAVRRSPAELWLFSLSPFFQEDIEGEGMRRSWLHQIGHRREASFRALKFSSLVEKLSSKTMFFYGSVELGEWPDIQYRDKCLMKPIFTKKIINGARHNVASDVYIAAIKALIAAL